jgi:hypothetical protein
MKKACILFVIIKYVYHITRVIKCKFCQYLILLNNIKNLQDYQWRTQEFCSGGGVQQIHMRTEGRENGDLGVVAP